MNMKSFLLLMACSLLGSLLHAAPTDQGAIPDVDISHPFNSDFTRDLNNSMADAGESDSAAASVEANSPLSGSSDSTALPQEPPGGMLHNTLNPDGSITQTDY